MFPAVLDISNLHVTLAGNGSAAARRLTQIRAAGAGRVEIYSPNPGPALTSIAADANLPRWPTAEEIRQTNVLFLAGMPDDVAEELAGHARAARVLVNTEDNKPLCDFHVPAMVRRGDLLLTVSTGGKAPGLSKHLRRELEQVFGPEWAAKLEHLADARARWLETGADLPELAELSEEYISTEFGGPQWVSQS